MKIKSVRNLASGILLMFLAAACACKLLLDGFQLRFLLSALLAVSISLVSFYFAFTHRGIEEELSRYADERDRYLAIKSGHATVRIMNYLLLGGCWIGLLLYGICKSFTKSALALSVAATLCGVLIAMFIIMLGVNFYYERRG